MNAKEANRRSRVGQAAAEKHFEPLRLKYEQTLRSNARRVAKAYRDTGIVAAAKVPTLDEVLAQATLSASATARTKAERQRIAEEAAHSIITDAGKRELKGLLEGIVAAQAGAQAERIVAGVRERAAAVMLEALIEGYSVDQTARLLQAALELDAEWQATMLARTDLISLANAASHKAAESLEDGPKFKTWLSAGDDRVRPTHVTANGQVVPIGMPYVLADGVELQYPGDPLGPDGETINCRCVSVFTDHPTPKLAHSSMGGIHDEPLTRLGDPVAAAGNPYHEKAGSRVGGRFARSPGGTVPTVPTDVVAEVADYQAQDVAERAYKRGMTPDEYMRASDDWLKGQMVGQEIRVRAPLEAVEGIVDTGQFTPGTLTDEGERGGNWGREHLEEQYFGGEHPVYGYVSGIPEDDGHPVTGYGDAVFRLKPEASARATVTLGDSANVLMDASREAAAFAPQPFVAPTHLAIDYQALGDPLDGVGFRDLYGVYPEAQVWGGVKLGDVREVVFMDGNAPSAGVAGKLDRAGVAWKTVDGQDPDPLPADLRPKVGGSYAHKTWVQPDGTATPLEVTGDYGGGVTYRVPGDTSDRGASYRGFLHMAGTDHGVTAAGAFDESKHPRFSRGDERGGQFSPKDGTSSRQATKEAEAAAKHAQTADGMDSEQLTMDVALTADRSMGHDVRLTGKLEDGKVYRVVGIKGVGTKDATLVTLRGPNGEMRQVFGHVEVEQVSGGFQGPDVPLAPAPAGPAEPTLVPGNEPIAPEPVVPEPVPEPVPVPPREPDPPAVPPQAEPPRVPKPVTPQVSNPVVPGSPAVNRPIKAGTLKPGETFRDTFGNTYTVKGPDPRSPRSYFVITKEDGSETLLRRNRGVYVDPGHPALLREKASKVSHIQGAYSGIFEKTPGAGTITTKAANLASLEAANVIALPDGLPQIELKATRSNSAAGQYWSRGATPLKITLRPDDGGDPLAMVPTMHHETGHYLDHGVLGRLTPSPEPVSLGAYVIGGDEARQGFYASVKRDPTVMGPVMDAIDSSQAIARVTAIAKTRDFSQVANAGTSYERVFAPDRKHARYLLSPTEKWARAYEQYQVTRAGRGAMYETEAALPMHVTQLKEGMNSNAFYGWQWTPEDFAPIEAEIDKMFGRLGWSKN